MSYIAYLCYPHPYEDDEEDDCEPTLKFSEPASWQYARVTPIQFSVLHNFTDKDKGLY